jgi:hypothetical protein
MGNEEKELGVPVAETAADLALKEHDKRLKKLEDAAAKSRPRLTELDAKLVSYVTNGTPDTQDPVSHGLGRAPSGFIVTSQEAAGSVYRTEQPWTADRMYLKCSAAGVRVTLLVF